LASDAYLSPKADDFFKALTAEEAAAWDVILWDVIADPLADGRAIELGFPYPAGTHGEPKAISGSRWSS